MKVIEYTIKFHSYWHCGSGLAAGADVDSLVIRDKDGLPFIPGKTMKGLIREAVDEILTICGKSFAYNEEDYLKLFGYVDDETEENKKDVEMKKSESFFANAEVTDAEAIKRNNLQRFMYSSISSTAIDENGVAVAHSLRKTQVVVPCTLKGRIYEVPEGMVEHVLNALRFIKNMGSNRNRGLGRCTLDGKEVNV